MYKRWIFMMIFHFQHDLTGFIKSEICRENVFILNIFYIPTITHIIWIFLIHRVHPALPALSSLNHTVHLCLSMRLTRYPGVISVIFGAIEKIHLLYWNHFLCQLNINYKFRDAYQTAMIIRSKSIKAQKKTLSLISTFFVKKIIRHHD